MNQAKFYKYAAWSLLLLNVVIIAFFFLTKPGPPPPKQGINFQSEVIDLLQLEGQQVTTFRKLATEHYQKSKSINDQQQKLLLPYFENLIDPSMAINEEDILSQFQELEGEKIKITHQHLQDIKNILDDTQIPHFERFAKRFIDQILIEKEKKPAPPRGS